MLDSHQVEDLYPLTPTQRGMLFHTLYAPQSGVYFQQEGFRLRGAFDLAAFRRAWERVLERHPVLRTAIVWEGIDEPVQVVFRQVRLPLEQHDWRATPPAEQRARLERFMEADRERGFDPLVAPLMRLALIRLADDAHEFIWSRHHLLLDGWSVSLVLKEVFVCYAAFRQGREPPLEQPRPYRNYLAWLQQQDVARAEAFWRATLAGFRVPTPLGVDRAPVRPPGQERYGDQWSHLPAELTAALHTLARAQRLTMNTLFQGAWALMLNRYSGEQDVVFGATGSGRPTTISGVETIAGLLINTLPVRVRVAPTERLLRWLRRIQAQQAESRHYDYSPLVDVQRWSEVPRGTPLFHSLLVYENFPAAISADDLEDALAVHSVQSFECTNYPLNLAVLPGPELALRAIYDVDRFDAATIARLLGHLRTILEAMLADPARRLADIPLLTEAERRQLLVDWNATDQGVRGQGSGVRGQCVHELFEAQVMRTPGAVALVFEQRRLTYRELDERANQLAHYLRARGVGPEVRVGVCVERSVDLVVALLGVLKAGGAYVPLDPADPIARLAFMLEEARAAVLLIQKSIYDLRFTIYDLEESGSAIVNRKSKIVNLDADWPAISTESRANPPVVATAGNLAALIFTARRGVLVEHRALWQRLERLQQAFGLAESDAVLHKASLAHGTALWEVFWPLLFGGRLVVALPEGQEDPDYLRQTIAEHAVSVVHFYPAALAAALDAWEPDPPRLASLRAVLCGGELLTDGLAGRFYEVFDCGLYQLYGPPEAATQALMRARRRADDHDAAPAAPIPTPVAYILDHAMRLLPIGVVGDLYLAEPGLARGYLGQPALNAECFVPNPFAEGMGDGGWGMEDSIPIPHPPSPFPRLYKTGDRGRRLNDGAIELARAGGRRVWIGDIRVELDEVEAALLEDPAVEDCAVLVRETPAHERALVAYVVVDGQFVPERLRARVSGRLPAALRPAAYVPVARVPLTPAGQVDEPALAQIELIDAELERRWEERLRSLPEIAQVAVVAQALAERPPALHLSDLLPDWSPPGDGAAPPSAPAVAQPAGEPDASPARPALADGGPLLVPRDAPKTLADALVQTAARHPQNGIVYIQTDGSALTQTYAELLDQARRILGGLRARGLKPGDRAILQIEQLNEHLPAFWACILGGIAPVTVAVAPAYTASNAVANKLYNAWELLGHPPILASEQLIAPLMGLGAVLPMRDPTILPVGELRGVAPTGQLYQPAPHELAFLQLTSGSTGIPRCIQETHAAVISYIHASRQVNSLTADDVALNWLPIDHVGALLMFHIRDLYLGCSQVQARTDMILAEPLAWLDLIERYRVTHTWSPNFGYKLLADHVSKAPGRTWDLSSVREFLNGGEQVTLTVVREFLAGVARFGVAPQAMQPAYGMAETCTAMTHARQFSLATGANAFDKRSLDGQLRRVAPDDESAVIFMQVGPPNPGVQIRIADRSNRVLPEGVIGRLQVKGAIITPGYLDNPEANREAFTDDGWFYTGDLGFILDGRLTITGREKEVIIINGANYYCYEIEDVVKRVAGVEATSVGVCEVDDPRSGSEALAVCFTPTVETLEERLEAIKTIRARVVASFGLNPLYVVPVPREQFPKTTSGKIQRMQLKAALSSGQFQAVLKEIDIHLASDNTLPDWFYRKVWRRREARPVLPRAATGQALVFLDAQGLGAALCADLSGPGQPCVGVEIGATFARLDRDRYRVEPGNPDHYRLLLESLARDGLRIDHILHLWTYAALAGEPTDAAAIERGLDEGVYSLLFLVQALNQIQSGARPLRLDVVSSCAQPVGAGDPIASERTAVLGLLKTIPHELPWLSCRHIDLPIDRVAANAALLRREVRTAQKEREVAYHDGRRLVARLEPADLREAPAQALPFKRGGMYLLSGGLGGIGGVLAKYLRERYDARLLLVGRTALPGDGETSAGAQSEDVPDQLRIWRELRQLGGELIYEAADICDVERLRGVVERARQRWGCELDGVIHLAGVYQDQLLTEATREGFAAMLRPKTLGTWALHQLVKDRPGSLFISFSSAHSLFGGFGVGAYAAANSFLDSFARYQRQESLRGFCFAWSIWDELGISRDLAVKDRLQARGYAVIAPQQGLYSLLAGLCHDEPDLLIGLDRGAPQVRRAIEAAPYRAQHLRAYFTSVDGRVPIEQLHRLEVHDRFQVRSLCDFVQLQELPLAPDGAPDLVALAALGGARAARKTVYVAPQTELERTIAALWQAALRIEKVGVHDNFFDLGGQSLLMTQVQGKLRATLGRDISMVDMFKYPTISALANYLSHEQPAPAVPQGTTDRTARQKEAIARQKQRAMSRRKIDE